MKKFRTVGGGARGVHNSEMSDGRTGDGSKHGTYVFSPTTLPRIICTTRSAPTILPPCPLLSVSTSQYPIRPIRKYSRGVICRGRRCPIGRHRFFRRRAPHASAAVARAAPLRAALAIPRCRRRVSRTIASGLISFSPDRVSHHRIVSHTHIYTHFIHKHYIAVYKVARVNAIRLYNNIT